jgi:hypothetical protein
MSTMSPTRLGSMFVRLACLPARQTRCSSDASSDTPTNRQKVIFGPSQRATHLFEGEMQTFTSGRRGPSLRQFSQNCPALASRGFRDGI